MNYENAAQTIAEDIAYQAALDAGSEIRGNHGIDVYAREDGYHVEHFALIGSRNDCKIVWTYGPHESREDAEQTMRDYKKLWN